MTVIYIDAVFLMNAAADGFLLLLTSRLAGIPLRPGRLILAALAGGAYAVAVFLPGGGFLAAGPSRWAVGVGLALIAFGREDRLFRLTALFFAVSWGFAGCVAALAMAAGGGAGGLFAYFTDLRLLIAAALGLLGVTMLRPAGTVQGTLLPVRVHLNGGTAELTALRDSGNRLRDGDCPVLVAAPEALSLPPEVRELLTPDRLRCPADLLEPLLSLAPELRPRLMPYRSVGVRSGLLLTVESRWVEADGVRYPGARIALSPTELGGDCQALWGGGRREGGLWPTVRRSALWGGAVERRKGGNHAVF